MLSLIFSSSKNWLLFKNQGQIHHSVERQSETVEKQPDSKIRELVLESGPTTF